MELTRRNFLGGAALAGVAAAVGMTGCSASSNKTSTDNAADDKAPQHNPVRTEECDIVVVGSGTAGTCATLRAAEKGAKVLCIEKNSGLMGTSAFAEGFTGVGSSFQEKQGISVDPAAVVAGTMNYHHCDCPSPHPVLWRQGHSDAVHHRRRPQGEYRYAGRERGRPGDRGSLCRRRRRKRHVRSELRRGRYVWRPARLVCDVRPLGSRARAFVNARFRLKNSRLSSVRNRRLYAAFPPFGIYASHFGNNPESFCPLEKGKGPRNPRGSEGLASSLTPKVSGGFARFCLLPMASDDQGIAMGGFPIMPQD